MPEKIIIAGGGLVGAMAACFLAKRGYPVDIYERRADLRKHEISAGRSINLALANRGIFSLQQLGLMQQVSKLLIPMRGRLVHNLDGSACFQPYGQKSDDVIYSVSRAALNGLLLDTAEATGKVRIRFNRELAGVDFEQKQAAFIDSGSAIKEAVSFDRLIGADGAGSRTRQLLGQLPQNSSELEWREQVEPLDHQYKELEIPAGPGARFQLEKHALHIWPRGGFMLIALPNLDGSFTVTLFLPQSSTAEGEPGFSSLQTPGDVETFFQTYFADVADLIPDLANRFLSSPIGHLGTVRCSPWNLRGTAVLIGDAAHAIVPFHGQGMNAGFEDCALLDSLIEQAPGDWEEIFRNFSAARIADANAIADMALENYIEMRDSVRDAKFLLKKAIGFELEKRFPRQFTPRYSMVMFQRLPYAEAQRKGEINKVILSRLAKGVERVEQVDWQKAQQLVSDLLRQ
jgi:kynurenine 3-monooxygenase